MPLPFDFDIAQNDPGAPIKVTAPRSPGEPTITVTGWPAGWTSFPMVLVATRGPNRVGIFRVTGFADGVLSGVAAVEGADAALKIGDRLASSDTAGNDAALKAAVATLNAINPAQIQCSGDSLTSGNGLADPATQSYPAGLAGLLGAGWSVANRGVGGATLDQLAAADVTRVDPLWSWQRPVNICSIFAGRNDLYFGTPVSQLIADYPAYCRARQQAGYRVIAWTMLPGVPTGNWTVADQQAFNTFVRANYGQFADALHDAAAIPGLADPTGPHYQADGVHPNAAGAALLAQGLYQVILAIDNGPFLHLTGDATISGTKTFAGNVIIGGTLAVGGLETTIAIVSGNFQTAGSNAGFTVARRDNNQAAYGLYSAAGELQLFGYQADRPVLQVDGGTASVTLGGTVTAPSFIARDANSGYYLTRRDTGGGTHLIKSDAGSFQVLSFAAGTDVLTIDPASHATFAGTVTTPGLHVSAMIAAADDTAAATAGVPVHGLYHDAGAVRIRLS